MKLFTRIFLLLLLAVCTTQLHAQTCPDTDFVGIIELNSSDAKLRWETNPDAQSYSITIERNGNVEVLNAAPSIMTPSHIDFNYVVSPAVFGPTDYLDIEIVTTCVNGTTSTANIAGLIFSLVTVEEVYAGKLPCSDDYVETCTSVDFHWVKTGTPLLRRINKNTDFGFFGDLTNTLSIDDFKWVKNAGGNETLCRCWDDKDFDPCFEISNLWRWAKNPNQCLVDNSIGGFGRLYELSTQVSPNPINQNAQINFDLPSDDYVSIALYNVQGKKVQSIVETEMFSQGYNAIQFNKEGLPTGLYQLMIKTTESIEMLKVVISD